MTVRLEAAGKVLDVATSNADGNFQFSVREPGRYLLTVVVPLGYELAVGEQGSRGVDLSSGAAVTVEPMALVVTSRIAFVSTRDGTRHLYVMNADGTRVRRLTGGTDVEWAPAWSSDGQRIAFNSGPAGDTYVVNADGSGLMRLSSSGGWPSWSPDGKRIVVVAWEPGGLPGEQALWPSRVLRIVKVDGSGVTEIPLPAWGGPDTLYYATRARWSPDGRRILVEVDRMFMGDPTTSISSFLMMNADGSDPHVLMNGCSAAWSPDGTRLALWGWPRVSVTNIDVVDPQSVLNDTEVWRTGCDGGGVGPEVWSSNAVDWSPDGQSLVAARWAWAEGWRLWIVDVRTGAARQLPTGGGGGHDFDAAWSRAVPPRAEF